MGRRHRSEVCYGPPDVLELRDIDKPEIEDEEVLVRVHAAGVDRGYGTS
ncbi:MAG TPA: hypothetical protein VHM69_00480 [Rubrobacter sp.]|nr:hypothetical protein [Rubrobacter sp.]